MARRPRSRVPVLLAVLVPLLAAGSARSETFDYMVERFEADGNYMCQNSDRERVDIRSRSTRLARPDVSKVLFLGKLGWGPSRTSPPNPAKAEGGEADARGLFMGSSDIASSGAPKS